MQSIYNIPQILFKKGLTHVVMSPGSRCAPLTVSFARHTGINDVVIPDERSAGFIGLGIAQQTDVPVALICTSGSAVYNYSPSIAEAFYQRIPMIVFSADRPPEWIDQLDGQTIRQNEIFGKHVKASFTLQSDYSNPDVAWEIERIINEAYNIANSYPKGPVHINVPFREPFYPKGEIQFSEHVKLFQEHESSGDLSESFKNEIDFDLKQYKKILVICGQNKPDHRLNHILNELQFPIIADVISNISGESIVAEQDLIFINKSDEEKENLRPDLVISFGMSVISKSLKQFIRNYKPSAHWHIQPAGKVADSFQTLSKVIRSDVSNFFDLLSQRGYVGQSDYKKLWLHYAQQAKEIKQKYFESNKNELTEQGFFYHLLQLLPDHSCLQLANSMPVRYANFLGIAKNKNIQVFSNRGTSGIDGAVSTSLGASLVASGQVVLFTGDMSFIYDRNALWNTTDKSNLRIIIFNNHGGGIFRLIDGPSELPELEKYFVTKQQFTAENTLKDVDSIYYKIEDYAGLDHALKTFFEPGKSMKVLEITIDPHLSLTAWKGFKKYF